VNISTRFFVVLCLLLGVSSVAYGESSLDPEDGKHLIVSVVFELPGIPKPPGRLSILSKLVNFGRGANGYGISLKSFETSVRPQVFWSRADGKGGFYTFGDYPFKARQRYTMTLVGKPGEFLALYLEERDQVATPENPLGTPSGKVKFLGGQDIHDVSSPRNDAPLNYKSPADFGDGFSSDYARVLGAFVGIRESLPESREKLGRFLRGAPETTNSELERDEVKLWEVSIVSK